MCCLYQYCYLCCWEVLCNLRIELIFWYLYRTFCILLTSNPWIQFISFWRAPTTANKLPQHLGPGLYLEPHLKSRIYVFAYFIDIYLDCKKIWCKWYIYLNFCCSQTLGDWACRMGQLLWLIWVVNYWLTLLKGFLLSCLFHFLCCLILCWHTKLARATCLPVILIWWILYTCWIKVSFAVLRRIALSELKLHADGVRSWRNA